MDALVVAHTADVHFAMCHTATTIRALTLFHLHAQQRHPGKQAVNRAQRAKEAAECAVDKHAGQQNQHHNDKFPREQNVQDGKLASINRV